MEKVNKFGRIYKTGVSLSEEMRMMIISNIINQGGDRTTGFFPSNYSNVLSPPRLMRGASTPSKFDRPK
jgi:hypothetical protein